MSVFSFFTQLVHQPVKVGAIVPSSRFLARRMLRDLDLSSDRVVVELGSGTGVFTREICQRMQNRGTLILIEQNEILARRLQQRFPRAVVVCDCATRLGQHLEAMGVPQVDYIVSGLPWTLFPREVQELGLAQVSMYLKPGGLFVTFIYLHGMRFANFGRRFESILRSKLGRFDKSAPVWRNIPPARVWTWRRPIQLPPPSGEAGRYRMRSDRHLLH